MAKNQLAKLGVRVMRSGTFLNEVYEAEPHAATHAVLRAAKDLKKPPYSVPDRVHQQIIRLTFRLTSGDSHVCRHNHLIEQGPDRDS